MAETLSKCKEFDERIRRRLRMCLWKEWKTTKTRVWKLKGLMVLTCKAFEWGTHARNTISLPAAPFYAKPSTIGVAEG
ncbi:group II intron maturase-specific domain-containing protein [Parageobacillus thermoglucosidasius]|uniref:Group II intron maturase-specific domain-containing protein n=1 Tax=Parageobacillus thermoglucosidasius TaxID=1426 RepID=A0A1B7KUC8_PARTM|nr:group II intron maturase-specific domain-containing protein [Parageobacillus thermoglucosidasius]OAT73671.1 hypothetical protein A7K69_18600 [Parageobacillus thermoglucosidasius]